MSEDFLKKISSQPKQEGSNPLSSLFKQKKEDFEAKEEIAATEKKKEAPAGFDGIENLGNSPTSKERFKEEPVQQDEQKPSAEPPKQEAEPEAPKKSDIFSKIPAKSLDNADIFASDSQDDGEGFIIKTNSSYETLNLDEEAPAQKASFPNEVIEEIAAMLRQNKPEEAISIINKHKQ